MIFGLDHLGGARYPDLAAREQPQGWAFGIFWNVDGFGKAEPLVRRVAKEGRTLIIRIQALWRDDHNRKPFDERDKIRAIKIARRVQSIAQEYKNIEFRFSPFCEHKNDARFIRDTFQKIKRVAPSLELVNSPNHDCSTVIEEAINEFHGAQKKPRACKRMQFSFDGTASEDSDVEEYKKNYAKAEIFFLWSPRFNGNFDGVTKPRKERKGWPDSNLIDSIIYTARARGECKLEKNHLFKSHSENKGKGDPRAEKPVYICPIRSSQVELVADNGQVVHALRLYGKYIDGRSRYYASDWGYSIAEKAVRIQGHPICKVRINGKIYGKVNPGFRFGSFRD